MSAAHLEVLVEEPSMEAFLGALLPRLLPADRTFIVHPFQGKADLLGKLQDRLRGYANWLPEDWCVVVVVDRDDDDCVALKAQLEAMAKKAKLRTRSGAGTYHRSEADSCTYNSSYTGCDAITHRSAETDCDNGISPSDSSSPGWAHRLSSVP